MNMQPSTASTLIETNKTKTDFHGLVANLIGHGMDASKHSSIHITYNKKKFWNYVCPKILLTLQPDDQMWCDDVVQCIEVSI